MEDSELLCTTIHVHLGIAAAALINTSLPPAGWKGLYFWNSDVFDQWCCGPSFWQLWLESCFPTVELLRWRGGLSSMPQRWGKFLLYWMTGKSPNTPNEGQHHSIYYQRGRNKGLLDSWGCSILHYNMEPWHRGHLLKRLDLGWIVGLRFAGPKLKLAITLWASFPLF